jgi:hypothetical protein
VKIPTQPIGLLRRAVGADFDSQLPPGGLVGADFVVDVSLPSGQGTGSETTTSTSRSAGRTAAGRRFRPRRIPTRVARARSPFPPLRAGRCASRLRAATTLPTCLDTPSGRGPARVGTASS